jgi:hypothetical protein
MEDLRWEEEDGYSPRSTGYGTPRDDRFFTPRALSTTSSGEFDQWCVQHAD